MSELYRVRDKNDPKKGPGKVWGENLSLTDAHKLKEIVVGSQKSRTARVEPMSAAVPAASAIANDPVIADVRKKATQAAAGVAAEAQRRADAKAAQKKLAAIPPVVVVPDLPDLDEDDLAAGLPDDMSPDEVDDLLADAVTEPPV